MAEEPVVEPVNLRLNVELKSEEKEFNEFLPKVYRNL